MTTDLEELVSLRMAVARIAQDLGVDNELQITGDKTLVLCTKAWNVNDGWRDLCDLIRMEIFAKQYAMEQCNPTPEQYEGSYDDPILET